VVHGGIYLVKLIPITEVAQFVMFISHFQVNPFIPKTRESVLSTMLFDLAQHLGKLVFTILALRQKKLAPGQIHGVGNVFSVRAPCEILLPTRSKLK
jgi:hypothetical protein